MSLQQLWGDQLKMIPAELGIGQTTSSERRVFDALKLYDIGGIALHSLNLPWHAYKLTSELDFVLVLEDLVLVIEVKGAQVSCNNGLWTYSDRSGHFRQDWEGPFKQVTSGMYALRKRLRERLGVVVDDIAFGSLVVTPDVDLAPSSFEWDIETYCGRGSFIRDFPKAISRAARYWKSRQPRKLRIDKRIHGLLIQELRPTFDRSPLLDARASTLDAVLVRLTDEQFSRLDLISDAPRVICSGGAGTGKTFLAAEISRRKALTGQSVLFACRSEVLAGFIRGILDGTGVTVCAESELPVNDEFDIVVIDEAQDLMNYSSLDRLEKVIKGGWSDGRWVMFMDQNRQAHLYGDYDPDALHFVQSFNPVPATLRTNCRNTKEIAFQTRALTGADTGVAAAGAGPEVKFVSVSDRESETLALEAQLQSLRDQEVLVGHVTIVSLRGDWETSSARGLREARRGRLKLLDRDSASSWPRPDLTWASAIDIKGLENRFVCVIDIDSLESEKDIDLLYVALSRPRAGLWLATNQKIASRMEALYNAHAPAALEALNGAGA